MAEFKRPNPNVSGLEDLIRLVLAEIEGPADIIAQSIGDALAIRVALDHPEKVRRLVLAATSEGIDVSAFRATDWRANYRQTYPAVAQWITEVKPDYSAGLSHILVPTLLLWGNQAPISPLGVGRHLCSLLPNAKLEIVPGGGHNFAQTHAAHVAALIERHWAAL